MTDSPYHGASMTRIIGAGETVNRLAERLARLRVFHEKLSLRAAMYPDQNEHVVPASAIGTLTQGSGELSPIRINGKLLLSVVEMDIVRILAALNESAQQIITATQSLPRIEVVDEQEKQT